MNVHCPGCGRAAVCGEIRPKDDHSPPRPVVPGSMFLCMGCGGVFEFRETGILVPWSREVPEAIEEASQIIRTLRSAYARQKAMLN